MAEKKPNRKILKIVAAVAVVVIVVVALYMTVLPSLFGPPPQRLLRAVWGTEPVNLNPHDFRTVQDYAMMQTVYEGLCRISPEGEVVGVLAESWKSADLIVWDFKLRQGVKFHDGKPFDAEAVAQIYAKLLDPKAPPYMQKGAISPPLKTVEAVDKYTARFTCDKRDAFLPNKLAYNPGFIASPYSFDNINTVAVGTGPFRFVQWVKGYQMVLERNPDYWGEKPWLDKIIYKFAMEGSVRVAMLEAGEVDVAERVSALDATRLKQTQNLDVMGGATQRVVQIGINCLKKPFDNPKVRQALNYAVDKEAIVNKIFLGYTTPVDCVVAKGCLHYVSTKYYKYDPDMAKKLLAEAGYPNGFKTTFQVGWGRITADKDVVEAVQSMLANVGVEAKIDAMVWAEHALRLRVAPEKATHELFLDSWGSVTAEPDWTVRRRYSKAGFPPDYNYCYYVNPRVEELTPTGPAEADPAKRLEIYKEIYKILMDEPAFIWLYHDPVLVGIRKGWTGIRVQSNVESVDLRYASFK